MTPLSSSFQFAFEIQWIPKFCVCVCVCVCSGAPPTPNNFVTSIEGRSTDSSVTFVLAWNQPFNLQHSIEMYNLSFNGNSSVNCPLTCLPSEQCLCSARVVGDGGTGNLTVSAVNCGIQEGPPTVITITPRSELHTV